ncbi:MAG: glycosyltransferase family 2 protein [Bacteroidales bacterium]|nr:glycosyltransferase family 2 protein [Bacteroidales bacterium]
MKHAPVLIPTLNRYEHLKRCLESLEKCTGADKTEVFVGLDYPPSEKYVDGWKKISEYLIHKEKRNGFKKLIVYRRETNYYFSGKGNLKSLINDLPKEYDSYIATEDDNEFSPCFLEYMNQNLEKYKDDDFVFRVCGYLPFKHHFSDEYSQFKADRHIAWGIGTWKSKNADYSNFLKRENIHLLYEDKSLVKKLEKDNLESILFSLVKMSKGGPTLGDVIVAAYLVYSNSRCILPTKSMVRNHGWDGSGQHGGYAYGYKEQEICTNYDYVMNEAPITFTEEFEREMHENRHQHHRTPNEWLSFFSWYLFKYTGIYCEFKYIHDFGKRIKNALRCPKKTK